MLDQLDKLDMQGWQEIKAKLVEHGCLQPDWLDGFDDRQRRIVLECIVYVESDPLGLPVGKVSLCHRYKVIIAKMVGLLDADDDR